MVLVYVWFQSYSPSADWVLRWPLALNPKCFCRTQRWELGAGTDSHYARTNGVQSTGKCHVFLPLCQGQSIPCQTNMENKPEELQLCLKTRSSFEAILAHKPWPHLGVSCYGEQWGGCTHIHTTACSPARSMPYHKPLPKESFQLLTQYDLSIEAEVLVQ